MVALNPTPLKVAICGGGIGGLALALVLKKFVRDKELTVDLYEAGPQFTEIGAGITLWDRSRYIFRELGLEDALGAKALSPALYGRKSDTKEPFVFCELHAAHASVTLARVEMLHFLLDGISATPQRDGFLTTHFSKRLTRYEQDVVGVTLHFQDGTSAQAAVLIGADGIGSATRRTMYAELAERVRATDPEQAEALSAHMLPSWTGMYIYRALVDAEKLRAISPNHIALSHAFTWSGIGKHAVSYPISQTTVNTVFIVSAPDGRGKPLQGHTVEAVSKEGVLEFVKDWEKDLQILVAAIDEVSKWALCEVHSLPQFFDGRVALLGDSAHAMVPYLGAGAGQAIEDANILGRILAHPSVTAHNIGDALKVYETIRKPIAEDVAQRSWRQGRIIAFRPEYLPSDVDLEKIKANDRDELAKVGKALEDIFSFHYSKMPGEDWNRAKALLERTLRGINVA